MTDDIDRCHGGCSATRRGKCGGSNERGARCAKRAHHKPPCLCEYHGGRAVPVYNDRRQTSDDAAIETYNRVMTAGELLTELHDKIEQLKLTEVAIAESFAKAFTITPVEPDYSRLALRLSVVRLAEALTRVRQYAADLGAEQETRLVVTNEQMDRMIEIVSGGASGDDRER